MCLYWESVEPNPEVKSVGIMHVSYSIQNSITGIIEFLYIIIKEKFHTISL